MSTEKLTRLKHLTALATRTKSELNALDLKIQEIVTVGGQPNVIEEIKLNGVKVNPVDKVVNLEITHPEYSVVKDENSGEFAAVYHLTKDGVNVGASINIPKDLVVKSGSVVGDEIVLVLNDEAGTEIKIPVGSLIEYVTSGSQTGDMVVITVDESTHKVTATITDGTITAAKLTTELQNKIGQAHSHTFDEEVLNGITSTKVAAWDAAEGNAKAYADGLAGNYDPAGSAATAETNAKSYADGLAVNYDGKGSAAQALTDAKAYADGLAVNYDAKGSAAAAETNAKAYADGLAGNYDVKGAAAAAETNAKAYADGLAGNYDAAGSAATAESNAKAYVDGMIATDAEVTAALDAVFGTQA